VTAEWLATTGGLEILCFVTRDSPSGAIGTVARLRPNLVVFCGAGGSDDSLLQEVLDACGRFVNDLHEMSGDNVLLVYDEDARDPRIADALGLGKSRVEMSECRTPRFFAYRYEEPLLFRDDLARAEIMQSNLAKLSALMPFVVRRRAAEGRRRRQPLDVVVKFANRRGQRLAQILGSAREYAAIVSATHWLADREPMPVSLSEEDQIFASPYAQIRPRAAPFFFEALACAVESGDVPASEDVAAVLCSGVLGGISMVEKHSGILPMIPEEWHLLHAPAADDDAGIAASLGSNADEVLILHRREGEGKISRPWTAAEMRAAAEYHENFQHLMTKLTSARRIDRRLSHAADECIAQLLILLYKAIGIVSENVRIPTADAAAAMLAAPLLRRGGALAATTCVGLFGLATGPSEFEYLTQLCIECATRNVAPALIAKSTAESALTLCLMDPAMEWRAGVSAMIETSDAPAVLNLATLCAAYRSVDALRWNVPSKIAAEIKKNIPRATIYRSAPEIADPEFEFGAAQDPHMPLSWAEVETEREAAATAAGPTVVTVEIAGPAPLKVVRLDDVLAFEGAAAPDPKIVGGPPDLFENEEQYRARILALRSEVEGREKTETPTFAKSALIALIDRCAAVGAGCSVAVAPWLSWHGISFAKVH